MKFVGLNDFFKAWSTYGVVLMGFWPEIWSAFEQISGMVQQAQASGEGYTYTLASKVLMVIVLLAKAIKQKRDTQGKLTLAAATEANTVIPANK